MVTPVADSGTPMSRRMRTQVAQALLGQGMSAEPVQHWTQGLARVAQALVGGTMANRLAGEERAEREGMAGLVQSVLGGQPMPAATSVPGVGGAPSVPPAGMSRVSSPSGAPATVATGAAPQFQELMRLLERSGVRIDPSQTGGFANRNIAGTNTPSQHASGRAVDINWRDNPEGSMVPQSTPLPYDMYGEDARKPTTQIHPDIARDAARRTGMRWGGDFSGRSPDPMHFEVQRGDLPRNPSFVDYAGARPQVAGAPAADAATAGSGGLNLSPQARAAISALARINPQAALGMVLPLVTRAEQPTEQQRNYAAYVRDQVARDLPVASFNDWGLEQRRAGATAITTVERGERAFESEAGKKLAQRYTDLVERGTDARVMSDQLNVLAQLSPRIGTGVGAVLRQRFGPLLEAAGIKVDGLSEAQTFTAIANQLAPRMRVAGSGATSDFEMRQYLASLPQLINTPGGNEAIARVNSAIAEHHVAAAEIASRALEGDITRSEAERQLRALPNPMAGVQIGGQSLQDWLRSNSGDRTESGTQPAGGVTRRYNPSTGQLE